MLIIIMLKLEINYSCLNNTDIICNILNYENIKSFSTVTLIFIT